MFRTYTALSAFIISMLMLSCSSPDRGSAEITLAEYTVTIDYGRPLMQGVDAIASTRKGDVWNFGMKNPTTFTTDTNLLFGAGYILAGTYSIWAQRGLKDHWFLLFNRYSGEEMKYDEAYDVAVFPFVYSKGDAHVERFTITLDSYEEQGKLIARWGTHRFEIEFSLPSQ